MRAERMNRVCTIGLVILSLAALLPVVVAALGILLSGQIPPPAQDEGTGARIFQLSIAALLPVGLLFLLTADWTQPSRIARRLVFPAAAVLVALGVLSYLEHELQRAQ